MDDEADFYKPSGKMPDGDKPFDISVYSDTCIKEFIHVLARCLCLWHAPTRAANTSYDVDYAIQLLLLKLRAHIPTATRDDVLKLKSHLIRSFVKAFQEHGPGKIARKALPFFDDLMFLRNIHVYVANLDIKAGCSFCDVHFYTLPALWGHMLKNHLPKENNQSERENDHKPTKASSATSRNLRNKIKAIKANSSKTLGIRRIKQSRNGKYSLRDLPKIDYKVLTSGRSKPSKAYLTQFSDDFLIAMIEEWRKNECLWKKSHGDYRNRQSKKNALDNLARIYYEHQNQPIEHEKIKALLRRMDQFHKRCIKSKTKIKRDHIWNLMDFLNADIIGCGDQVGNNNKNKINKRVNNVNNNYNKKKELLCPYCNKLYKRAQSLANHTLRYHPPTSCPLCENANFPDADELKGHVVVDHFSSTKCPLCDKDGIDWNSHEHMRQHFYEHVCPTCDLIFHDEENFKGHRKICTTYIFKCNYCEKRVKGALALRRHAYMQHRDKHPLQCKNCNFKRRAPKKLKRSVVNLHIDANSSI